MYTLTHVDALACEKWSKVQICTKVPRKMLKCGKCGVIGHRQNHGASVQIHFSLISLTFDMVPFDLCFNLDFDSKCIFVMRTDIVSLIVPELYATLETFAKYFYSC
uniref:Uncharacterized protein n=1 Tax=Triticum urartu TaxID=4572 RepID=A0A8R7PE32_TRIUA